LTEVISASVTQGRAVRVAVGPAEETRPETAARPIRPWSSLRVKSVCLIRWLGHLTVLAERNRCFSDGAGPPARHLRPPIGSSCFLSRPISGKNKVLRWDSPPFRKRSSSV